MSDPWKETEEKTDNPITSFEDNFIAESSDSNKLPDSDEYLNKLEAKLRRLKKNPSVLKQLSDRREQCMENLLNGEINLESNLELEAPIEDNHLLRVINPEQPITAGEVVHLIKHDELEASNQEPADSPSR